MPRVHLGRLPEIRLGSSGAGDIAWALDGDTAAPSARGDLALAKLTPCEEILAPEILAALSLGAGSPHGWRMEQSFCRALLCMAVVVKTKGTSLG